MSCPFLFASRPLARTIKVQAAYKYGTLEVVAFKRGLNGPARVFMVTYLPTVIVRSPRENTRKCSILPLKGRSDLLFVTYPVTGPLTLEGYIRLAAEGEELSLRDAAQGILLLDGSWRWAGVMNRDFLDVPPRSLHGYQTAYPRTSKRGTDPEHGLASVEALFLAYHILRRPTAGLLEHYRWADEFLRLNGLLN